MATTSNLNISLNTIQIFDLVKQLPLTEKNDLLHLLEDDILNENYKVPVWQMELAKKELENITTNNTVLMQWEDAKKQMLL